MVLQWARKIKRCCVCVVEVSRKVRDMLASCTWLLNTRCVSFCRLVNWKTLHITFWVHLMPQLLLWIWLPCLSCSNLEFMWLIPWLPLLPIDCTILQDCGPKFLSIGYPWLTCTGSKLPHAYTFYLFKFSLLWLLNLPMCIGFFHWAIFTPKGLGLCVNWSV